jgi:hypothetical protein
MLAQLHGWASRRKLRLFEAACGRAVWPLLEHAASEQAVEAALLDADGLIGPEELHRVAREANDAWARVQQDTESDSPMAPLFASEAAYLLVAAPEERERWRTDPPALAAEALAASAVDRVRRRVPGGLAPLTDSPAERKAARRGLAAALRRQADLLRDLFGSPFRPVLFDLAWLSWGGGVIPNLAAAIYAEGAFERLPILADALEQAGCDNADLLGHCRGRGPHVPGCWVVDLLLGKQ